MNLNFNFVMFNVTFWLKKYYICEISCNSALYKKKTVLCPVSVILSMLYVCNCEMFSYVCSVPSLIPGRNVELLISSIVWIAANDSRNVSKSKLENKETRLSIKIGCNCTYDSMKGLCTYSEKMNGSGHVHL